MFEDCVNFFYFLPKKKVGFFVTFYGFWADNGFFFDVVGLFFTRVKIFQRCRI